VFRVEQFPFDSGPKRAICNFVGGVLSPLSSKIYFHWFDKVFHRKDGPAKWAGAKLVRYADDLVVREARNLDGVGDQPGKDANREPEERRGKPGLSGYTFRYERELKPEFRS
jgi:RNA-directed DNA polymerase